MTDKDQLREAFLKGYELGKGVEELQPISVKTAEARFDRWYRINGKDDE